MDSGHTQDSSDPERLLERIETGQMLINIRAAVARVRAQAAGIQAALDRIPPASPGPTGLVAPRLTHPGETPR
jgi:hypothetical protein